MHPRLVVVLVALGLTLVVGCAARQRPRAAYGPLPPAPSREDLARAMADASERINGCVNGTRDGTLHASVVFAPHGLVAEVELAGFEAPLDEVAMRSCVLDVLYRLEVEPFEGKEVRVDVAYELW